MAGKTIARYEIQSEIGRGGMAAVYLAYDPNFRRNVAIKLISGNLQENPTIRERFEREAHLIAKIEHPAIVPVYDYGEQDNQLYLVMRYMPGDALTRKIKEGKLNFGYATQIISQIAPALDAVHSHGIVHRDLKPGNILFDSFGNPAISDFGIAYLTTGTTDLTGNAIIGTPSYMSPEQVRGDSDLDGRSDVYALGVILFEMLTGRGPFQAKTPLSVAMKHLTDPLPSIRSFRPDLPVELELILTKAMAKDRNLRYVSASELARELRAIAATFDESSAPVPDPMLFSSREEISTEVDMENASIASPSSGAFQPVPESKAIASSSTNKSPKPIPNSKRSPQRKLQIASITGLGLFLLLICGTLCLFGVWAGLNGPWLSPSQTQSVQPTLTVTEETILFADDFSNPESGWPSGQNARGEYGYQLDSYRILVYEMEDAVLWVETKRQDANVNIYVNANPVTEGMNGYYGLRCRIQDDQNFYYFVIRNNGDYTIGKYKNAEFLPFFDWKQSAAIKQGNQINRLRVECAGNTLRLYVNNIKLDEVNDADFSSGANGVVAAALGDQGFEVIFDNFLITEASQ